jgi:Ca-activated chloride channel family protein
MLGFLGIYFAETRSLILLPLIFLVLFFLFRNYNRLKNGLKVLTASNNKGAVLKNFSFYRFFVKNLFFVLALFFLVVAFFRPQWGKKENIIVEEGRDVLIALDISRSMLGKDLKPDRLKFAKLKIRNLLSKFDFERVGLLLFSGEAFVQCPMTSDYSAFLMFLEQVDAETISSGTTSLAIAFSEMVKMFQSSADRKNRLVVLISDGEDFSVNLTAAKKMVKEEDVKIFGLGVGTPQGAPIPILNNKGIQVGHEMDDKGKPVLSVLNENLLQQICNEMGGVYVRASYDDSDLDNITSRIKQFEKEKFSDRKVSNFEERYPLFLGIAWGLFLLEWIL